MSKRVVVGLSGGVDSSVTAYLLKEQGYDVTAVFMINWHGKTGLLKGDCPWDEDVMFAEMVAKKLDIPFHVVDLSEQYRKRIVEYMFAEYEKGRTPNPDVLCNREIKFDEFFHAIEKFEPDYVATGHFCKKDEILVDGKKYYRLLAGDDPGKEQSYFLCQLNQEQLKKTLFPIGHLHKSEIREIARKKKLASADKKDSQGICFIGKVDLPTFLQQKLEVKEGDIVEIPADLPLFKKENNDIQAFIKPYNYRKEDGKVVGTHHGAHFFTIGQRKGLNVGGKDQALFVIATDIENNIIYTGQGQEHPGLLRKGLLVKSDEIHWIRPDLEMKVGDERDYLTRIRYRQPLQKATLKRMEDGMYFAFESDQRGIAAGQFAAWYDGNELIGSGVIS
jgi:tRNA-specific 2-thiouridylase